MCQVVQTSEDALTTRPGWTGEERQTFLGFNSRGGVNLRVTFTLRPPAQ